VWGKHEEEERLTGRAETRRTVAEWTAVLVSTVAMAILALALFLMTCNLILRALDAGLPPPGTLYAVDDSKYLLHVYCQGNKTDARGRALPTVLLEAEGPVEHELWAFADNAIRNGSIARYCFVDRPGMAWSDTAPSPSSAGMVVEAVSEALARAGESDGPWVLLGLGAGSLYSRVLASRSGDAVHGLVLVDPLHEDLLHRVAAPGRGFLLWLRGVLSPLGLDRIPGAVFGGRSKEDRVWGPAAYQSAKYIFAKLQENLVAESLTKRDVVTSRAIQNKDTPLALISSGDKIRADYEWEEKQRDLSHLTSRLEHWDVVDGVPHQIWNTYEGRQVMERRLSQMVFKAV
jgi:pimeloyl-ACP methyl ester carboxylesterase